MNLYRSLFHRAALCTLAFAGALALPFAHAHAGGSPPGQVVITENGPVSGTVTNDGRKFLGIPYAAPPVGNLRWKPPAAPANWTAPRDATHFGNNCPQAPTPFGLPSANEDCLFLNVYTPPVGVLPSPVIVWIHGGAFQFGESNDYDPRALVGKNVVVVSINYRLGALGFLAHPALTSEGGGTSGNYGFLDQQAALRWVKRNIARFGGNPLDVTIAGQSAGGLSVHTHLAAPGSAGLFQQAIAQSGAYMLAPPTVAVAETQGTAYATAVGCSSQTAACLRAVPVTTLLANQPTSPVAYLPRVDGIILPKAMDAAFTSGQFNKVPVIEGSTHDEYRLFVAAFFTFAQPPIPVNAATYPTLIATILQLTPAQAQVVVPLVMAQYPLANYTSGELALAAVGTDSTFACNALRATSLLAPFTPTWAYEFDDEDAPQIYLPPAPFDYGAYHGSELPYLFNMRIAQGAVVPSPLLNPAQQQLSDSMVLQWSRFARFGNPNAPLQTQLWPRFLLPLSQNVQLLVPPQPQNYTATAFQTDHKCSFWAQLAGGS